MGLGTPVVLTCSADYIGHFASPGPNDAGAPTVTTLPWFKQVAEHGFDIRQYPITQWTDAAGLGKSLKDRIEALGLSLKAAPQ